MKNNTRPDFTSYRGIGMTSERTRNRLVLRLREQNIQNEEVLEVMSVTPRHLFVDEALASRSYEDTALPIGFSQTISQPYVVARMTEALLSNTDTQKILEVGTGSGYQTAILAQLFNQVYTVERISSLLKIAQQRFTQLGFKNIVSQCSDGHLGFEKHAPFDGIIVTAAPARIPENLLAQLKLNGHIIIPVGSQGMQELTMMTKTSAGYQKTILDTVTFVPLCSGVI